MEEVMMKVLHDLNIGQLIAIGGMFWFFYRRLDVKIEKLDLKLSNSINGLDVKFSSKIDKLDEKVADLDKRLFSVERMMHMKECCMIKDSSQMRKAE